MANPQSEYGHTRIANEIMEALGHIRIPGEAMQVLLVILRQTYGWNRKTDAISLSQFVEKTGMLKPHIIDSIKKLINMNIVTEKGKAVTEKGNELGKIFEFNKDYDTWKPLPKKVTLPKKVKTVTEKGNVPLPKKVPTKTSIKTKKSIMREIPPLLDDVVAYCRERGNTIDAQYFCDWYQAKDWMIGPNKMKDWKAAVRTWEKKSGNGTGQQPEETYMDKKLKEIGYTGGPKHDDYPRNAG
jgi:phage replication O-like protein O